MKPIAPPPFHVTFVCMGNICRSPTAHGVFRHRVQAAGWADRITIDSAGTHAHWEGAPADERSAEHAARRGYDLSDLRARGLRATDFARSDLLLVMDHTNLQAVLQRCPPEQAARVRRLTTFCRRHDSAEVPDPYYGGAQGFEQVLDLIEDACEGLLEHVQAQWHGRLADGRAQQNLSRASRPASTGS